MKYLNNIRIITTALLVTVISAFTLQQYPVYQKSYNQAIENIKDSSYKEANAVFLQLIKAELILPDATAFHFGKSLYYTSFYRQSKALLEKYEQLTKKKGSHHDEANNLLTNLNKILKKKEKVKKEIEITDIKKHNEATTCDGHDYYICPVCNGSKVILKQTSLGQIFTACDYCDDHGQMDCKVYAKYLNGTLFD